MTRVKTSSLGKLSGAVITGQLEVLSAVLPSEPGSSIKGLRLFLSGSEAGDSEEQLGLCGANPVTLSATYLGGPHAGPGLGTATGERPPDCGRFAGAEEME